MLGWCFILALAEISQGKISRGIGCKGKRFGLESASGESGAEGGEQRLADRSRSETPAAEPQTEAGRSCGAGPCKPVTSARFEKRSGRRQEGDGATSSLCSEATRAVAIREKVLAA